MELGQLITAYSSGIHEVTGIKRRYYDGEGSEMGEEYGSLISYKKVLNEDGTVPTRKNKVTECDAGFCNPVELFVKKKEQELLTLKQALEQWTLK